MALHFLLNFYGISSAPESLVTGKAEREDLLLEGTGWGQSGSLLPRGDRMRIACVPGAQRGQEGDCLVPWYPEGTG